MEEKRKGLAGILISLAVAVGLPVGCAGARPEGLGVKQGALAACPDSPNCVSSQAADRGHEIEPLKLESSSARTLEKLEGIIRSMKGASIVDETDDCLHAEFRTTLGFVDDLEIYVDAKGGVVHLRSASRVGYWDLGVNRKRVEALRAQYER